MNKYRVEGTMVAKGKVEFIVLARSLDDAMDLCDEDPRDFLDLSALESNTCEIAFEAGEVIEVGPKAVSSRQ